MAPHAKIPATGPGSRDSLEKLLKIDSASSLPGYSRGIQASFAYTPETWREQGLSIARQLADTGEPFTVRDLKAHGLPEPEAKNHWGSLVAAIRQRKIAQQIGWTGVSAKNGDTSGVRVWQGAAHG